MNTRSRLAALAPLALSSLALGSLPLTAAPAQAATPKATCHVTQDAQKPDRFNVIGTGLTPGADVSISQGGATAFLRASADGGLSGTLTVSQKGGPVSMQEEGGPKLSCGSVKQAEEQQTQDQFAKGFKDGFNLAKATCKAQAPQGVTAVDPNYEKGFNAGAAAAIAKFC
ncbi:hypothetical protein ACWEWG_30210 [Streptomyces sp. NPDC003758]|uniref:Secreted protein n=1 Tax=Streptomyces cynarae TaxID=2981134 RepID=A0ABY6E287_9ACTN|nr:hypothetical protein [Streptomyces cynarae]UXY20784.1 hypothetical protein N8I84_20305 [Streptomyces cynarae]